MSTFQVSLLPSQQKFKVNQGEIILDAAIRQGVDVTYTCRNGTCRTCLFQVLEGNVIAEEVEHVMLSEEELTMNKRLICMSTLCSDAVLEKPARRRRDPS